MPEWLSVLLASPLVIGAVTFAGREVAKALAARAAAKVSRVKAEVLRLNAETERMYAEARVRESQARITESDGVALRETLAKVLEEREQDRREAHATRDALDGLQRDFGRLKDALYATEAAREKAERENHAMRREWGQIWRTRRLPSATPQAFAAVDPSVPFRTEGKP